MADFNRETQSIAQAILNDEYGTASELLADMKLASITCGVSYVRVSEQVAKLTLTAK